jgi:type VI protein secretion system component VasK
VIARWLQDVADRLETATEIVRETNAAAWVSSDSLEQQLTTLETRLHQTSQRLGLLRSLTPEARQRYARTLDDLHSATLRCLRFACAEECGAAYDGLDVVASELGSIVIEFETLDHLDSTRTTPPRPAARLRAASGGRP